MNRPFLSKNLLQFLNVPSSAPKQPCNRLSTLHTSCRQKLHSSRSQWMFKRQYASQPVDDPNFVSLVDVPQQIVRVRRKHSFGIVVLAIIPVTAFALGTWQIQRLKWKTDLIAKFEDRLVLDPLPLPPTIDQSVVPDFDYRRVYATGKLRHDQEVLIGPRVHDGQDGFLVMTPLERGKGESKILVARGWVPKEKKLHKNRKGGLPGGVVTVQGLLREPFKKNMFTPENKPEKGEFYFPDIPQIAMVTGSEPVFVEETMPPDLYTAWDREAKGIPIGRGAEVNLRNNHTQYIFTWYSLAIATSIMFYMVVRKPSSAITSRVRHSREW